MEYRLHIETRGYIALYRGCSRIMEKKMEATSLEFRGLGLRGFRV